MIDAAVIGVGYWGPNLLRNLHSHPSTRVRWVCDSNRATLQKALRNYPGVSGTVDFREVIKDPKIDLIVIATPVHTHFELGMAALESGKHLLLTKPMAMTTRECEGLIEMAAKHRRVLMVDHTFVFHPAVQKMKEMVEKKQLGELLYYQSSRMNLGLYQPDVSVVYDLMPHDISILNEFIDEDPIGISAVAKNAAGLPQPDLAHLSLNYQSNFIASVDMSWLSPSKVRLTTLTGRKKMVLYDDTDVVSKIKVFDKGVDHIDFEDREGNYTNFLQYRNGDIRCPEIANTEALRNELDHLVECIERNLTPKTDGIAGMRVIRILEKADSLARSKKCWVDF